MARVGFVTALVVLVAAIPALALIGRGLIENSRDGKVLTPISDPRAAGYQALVDPTPTALVVQTDDAGKLKSATMLALGAGDAGGGSVVLIPVDTKLARPASGVDRLRSSYQFGGVPVFRDQVAALLGVGLGEVIEVNDTRWSELVRPLGSVTVDNPDSVTGAGGQVFASGRLKLTPGKVGPFLSAIDSGESDLNRMVRQKLFWEAWVKAVAAGGNRADLVPGESGSGISRFVHTLAKGTTDVSTLAVDDSHSGDGPPFVANDAQLRRQIAIAVPFPVSAYPGQRVRVRLLDGVKPGALANNVTDALVLGGAEITALGNASRFGQSDTQVEYYSKDMRERALLLQASLHVGKLVYKARPDESVDVTVTIGSDIGRAAITEPMTTQPTTTAPLTTVVPLTDAPVASTPTTRSDSSSGSSGGGSSTSGSTSGRRRTTTSTTQPRRRSTSSGGSSSGGSSSSGTSSRVGGASSG